MVKYPDPRLTQASRKAQINGDLRTLAEQMQELIKTYQDPEAAGLSAVQVGVPVRLLIARDLANPVDQLILINPKFVSRSKEEELDWEGCLSFPDLYGRVWRAKKVKLKYQDLEGRDQRLTAAGFLARVLQHEMDHLAGVTFDTKVVGKLQHASELEANANISD